MKKIKILVVSDSHGQNYLVKRAIAQEAPFDILVHAGDVEGSLRKELGDPAEYGVCAVAGNMDWHDEYPDSRCFTAGGRRFYLVHGHRHGVHGSRDRLVKAAIENGAEIVIFGHTHMPVLEERDGITVLNPGSIAKPRQQGWKKTYAVIELPVDDDGRPAGEPRITIRSLKGRGLLS